jgi:hypothetical protein
MFSEKMVPGTVTAFETEVSLKQKRRKNTQLALTL